MANFSVENVWASAPTKWQARNEFESILDRNVGMREIVEEDKE